MKTKYCILTRHYEDVPVFVPIISPMTGRTIANGEPGRLVTYQLKKYYQLVTKNKLGYKLIPLLNLLIIKNLVQDIATKFFYGKTAVPTFDVFEIICFYV